jgi:hypothetical protein
LNVLEIIFFVWGKTSPRKKSVEMPHYMLCPRKKIISLTFKISGALIVIKQWFLAPK